MSKTPIPCYIQNRDTMSVIGMVEHLAKCELAIPVVCDAGSTYPPLLDAYRELERNGICVQRFDNRWRNHTIWNRPVECWLPTDRFYFASDGDLDMSGVAFDFLAKFQDTLAENPQLLKVGCGLRIDDVPRDTPFYDAVIAYGRGGYWDVPVCEAHGVTWYTADIDTTACLCRAGIGWTGYNPAWMSGTGYDVRHLAWYLNRDNITEDWLWYLSYLENVNGLGWSSRMREYFCAPN